MGIKIAENFVGLVINFNFEEKMNIQLFYRKKHMTRQSKSYT